MYYSAYLNLRWIGCFNISLHEKFYNIEENQRMVASEWKLSFKPKEYQIRLYNECEGGIENSVQRIADWPQEACRVMTNGDREGRIFLYHPHTND